MQNKADMKVIKVWKNMSVLQLADAMDKDLGKLDQDTMLNRILVLFFSLDHVFEVMIYVDNSADYDEPWKCIDNLKVIQDIVKKSGMRCMIASEPTSHTTTKEVKDAEKR